MHKHLKKWSCNHHMQGPSHQAGSNTLAGWSKCSETLVTGIRKYKNKQLLLYLDT